MGTRLVPSYIEKPAWETYSAFVYSISDEDPDPDVLRDAITRLRDALLRAQAVRFAPDDVLEEWMNDPAH